MRLISDTCLSTRFRGLPLASKRVLKLELFSSKVVSEDFVFIELRSLWTFFLRLAGDKRFIALKGF